MIKRSYTKNLLIAIDQLLNAVFKGEPDETISSRAYRRRLEGSTKWGYFEKVIDILFYKDKAILPNGNVVKHCQLSMLAEMIQAKTGYRVYKYDAHKDIIRQLQENGRFPY